MKIHTITWKDSVWFADIDDTLIDTARLTAQASEGIRSVFKNAYGEETALRVQKNFIDIFTLMMLGLRNKSAEDWEKYPQEKEAFHELWSKIEDCQQEIKEHYGAVKKFSREIFIKLAAEREQLTVDPEMIYEAADYYWLLLSEKTQPLPGVVQLIQEIKKHNRPFYLMTSSDGRLKIKPNGQFFYDPSYSENFKRERVQLLREKGIDFNIVSIGDPEDKPHLDFFQKGIKAAEEDLRQKIKMSNAIIMGDSFAADLQTPKEQLDFGLVVHYQEGKSTTDIIDEHYITTGNLSEITKFLV